jgi:hydroxymethylpyrimidine pyrophosphatase-like HAD family hydrolase
MARVICFDIDGVLTEDVDTHHDDLPGTYVYRRPSAEAREVMRRAYAQGWTVLLFTGRREAQRRITEDWLGQNGFHWHFLRMDKPYYPDS